MSLCEKNCFYKGYNSTIKKSICECPIKESENNIKNSLNNLFIIKDIINFKVMKCFKKLFTSEVFRINIGNYILASLIILNIFLVIILIIKESKLLEKIIYQKMRNNIGLKKVFNNINKFPLKTKKILLKNLQIEIFYITKI